MAAAGVDRLSGRSVLRRCGRLAGGTGVRVVIELPAPPRGGAPGDGSVSDGFELSRMAKPPSTGMGMIARTIQSGRRPFPGLLPNAKFSKARGTRVHRGSPAFRGLRRRRPYSDLRRRSMGLRALPIAGAGGLSRRMTWGRPEPAPGAETLTRRGQVATSRGAQHMRCLAIGSSESLRPSSPRPAD